MFYGFVYGIFFGYCVLYKVVSGISNNSVVLILGNINEKEL